MTCPKCGSENNRIVDSRQRDNTTMRRRWCNNCGLRFNTLEVQEEKYKKILSRDLAIRELLRGLEDD